MREARKAIPRGRLHVCEMRVELSGVSESVSPLNTGPSRSRQLSARKPWADPRSALRFALVGPGFVEESSLVDLVFVNCGSYDMHRPEPSGLRLRRAPWHYL